MDVSLKKYEPDDTPFGRVGDFIEGLYQHLFWDRDAEPNAPPPPPLDRKLLDDLCAVVNELRDFRKSTPST